jgi:AmmeMemoRadiSam system protein A
MYAAEEQTIILKIARLAIEHYLNTGKKLDSDLPFDVTGALALQRACFVTLKKNIVELRGCVGTVMAVQPLYLDIIENSIAAAFHDDRFFPITKEELSDIEIEVSVLTEPKKIEFSSSQELMDKLEVGVDGVIVQKGDKSAAYLPQVWDEMLEKHNFLSSLCLKAGLEPDEWQKPGVDVFTYQVEIVSENDVAV